MAYAYRRFEDHEKRQHSKRMLRAPLKSDTSTRSLAEVIDLVERKLEWIGLESMQIAHVCITDDTVQIDLVLNNFDDTCRLEVDRTTGAITRYDGLLWSESVEN